MEIFKWQKFLVLKKVKLSLHTPWRHTVGAYAQIFFLNLSTRWRQAVIITPQALYAAPPQQLLKRRLGWHQPGCLKRRHKSLAQIIQPVPLSLYWHYSFQDILLFWRMDKHQWEACHCFFANKLSISGCPWKWCNCGRFPIFHYHINFYTYF